MKLEPLHTLSHNNGVYWASFSSDGKRLATASLDNAVKLWNPLTGEHVGTLKGHGDGVAFVEFLKDGRLVTASLDKTVRIWSADGELKTTFAGHQEYLSCAAVARDGSLIVSGGFDKTVRLWDPQSGGALAALAGHTDTVQAVAVSNDGKTVASAGEDLSIRLWDVASKSLKKTLPGHSATVEALTYSPKDGRLTSAGADGLIRFWNDDGSLGASVDGRSAKVKSLGYSADGRWLASGGGDGGVRVWDAATLELAASLDKAHRNTVYGVAFAPDATLLASASFDRTIVVARVSGA